MQTRRRAGLRALVPAAALAGTVAIALAQVPVKLPQDLVFQKGEGSPGRVTFRHPAHVAPQRPDCTPCHPALFRMLEREFPAKYGPQFHAEMEDGRHCGACHDGGAAFEMADCLACHEQEE